MAEDWLMVTAKEMAHGLRLMQDRGIMPPQYGTSIPDTMLALIRRIDRLEGRQEYQERPR